MISKPNNDDASTVAGSHARSSLLGLLLLSVGLLLSILQPAVAQTYTPSPQKDYSVAPSGLDVVAITETPTPPSGTISTLYVSINGSTSLISVTLVNGVGDVQFSTNAPGTVPVAIFSNPDGDPASLVGSISMHFIAAPGPPVAANSYFTVSTNNASADGQAQDVVEAFLFDANGNAIDASYNASVTWVIPPGYPNAAFVPAVGATATVNNSGTASVPLTDSKAESVPVTATFTYTDPSTHTTFTFPLTDNIAAGPTFVQPQPNTTSGASYIVTVVSPNPANGSAEDEVQVYVVDGSGVPMSGVNVSFTIPGVLTLDPSSTTTTNGSGMATIYLKTFTAGTYQIQATVNGQPLFDQANPANNYVTVVFYNPPPSPAASWITPVITPMPVGGQDEVEIHLSTGTSALANATVTLNAPAGVTIVTPGPYITDANGNVFVYLTSTIPNQPFDIAATYVDPAPGGLTYTLNDETITTQPYSIVEWVPGPVDASKSYIVVTQDNATADDVATDIVTAYLYDSYGNPIIGSDNPSLVWNVSPTTPTIQSTTSSPNSNVYTVSYVSTAVGPFTVTLQAGGVTVNEQTTNNPFVTIHFVTSTPVTGDPGGPTDGGNPGGGNPGSGGTPPNNGGGNNGGGGGNNGGGNGSGTGPGSNNGYTVIYVEPQYNDRLADGQQQDSVYVLVTDAYKHPISNVTVTFYIANPGGTITSGEQFTTSPSGGPITVTTGPDGIARAAMTSTATGSVWVYASIVVGGTPQLVAAEAGTNSTDVELDFVTKPDVTNIQTALTVIIGQALSDGIQTNEVKAHVVDLDGNVMPNQQVYFAIDSGTGTIVTPQPVLTDANGDAYIQITSKTVGYVLITATVDSEKIVFGSPARVYFAQINIYVPRAFSPNNDGVNDLLKPILVGITTFHYFSIYNRWGNLIFTTQDPNQGWDGTFKGVPQPVETYLWIAEGIDENGRKVVQKGMTSLVR